MENVSGVKDGQFCYKAKNIKSRHAFFVGKCIYEGNELNLNVSQKAQEQPGQVEKAMVFMSTFLDAKKIITPRQAHTSNVLVIEEPEFWSASSQQIESDALVLTAPGFAAGVVTADCVPILLEIDCNDNVGGEGRIVAAIHAGWRGAFGGVVEKTLQTISKKFRINESNSNLIRCAIGPSIFAKNYEVDTEFSSAFLSKSINNAKYFEQNNSRNKFNFNLRSYVFDKLCNFCPKENIEYINIDTYSTPSLFSHRRQHTLRQLSCIVC